jgi:hypothetical protein
VSQRASYIGAIQADQTVESDHSDLLVQWGTRLPGHVLLQLALNLVNHLHSKHIRVQYHAIQDFIKNGNI